METCDWTQYGLLIVAIITVIASTIYSCWAVLTTRDLAKKQYQFQFFAEYTKRYQDLVLQMPDDLDTTSIHSKNVDKFMRLYFDLCSEEYYLHSKGVIDEKVWGLWVDGISTTMNKQKYKTAWKLLGSYYDDANYVHFMNNLTRDKL